MVKWLAFVVILAASAIVFVMANGGGISKEAAALIADGDTAQEAAEARQAEAEAIAERLDRLLAEAGQTGSDGQGADPSISRSIASQGQPAEITALREELESVLAEKLMLENRATELWLKAASIDAEAQDAIIQRMRGTRPKS